MNPCKPKTSPKGEASLNSILNAAEQLMLKEGYAAVSSRRVAKEAGLKPPLVHYYFPTTDDLFLALIRRAAAREMKSLDEVMANPDSITQYWMNLCERPRTALAIEFMALANHRKAIRDEITALTEQEQLRRAELLNTLLGNGCSLPNQLSSIGLNLLLISVARTLTMESGLGIELGHEEAKQFVKYCLGQLPDSRVRNTAISAQNYHS